MIDTCFRPEIPHEPNYSVQYAVYLVLRRQPWKAMAAKMCGTIRCVFLLMLGAVSLAVVSLGAVLPVPIHARTYDALADEATELLIAALGGGESLGL